VLAGAAQIGAPPDLRQPARQSSPATRAMRLTRTGPQTATPDESPTGVWPGGPRDGYTGSFDTAGFETDGYGDRGAGGRGDGRFDTKGFEQVPDDEDDEDEYDKPGGRRHGHGGSRHRYDDDDDDYGHRGRRRWPIVTGALVLLVLLLGGGAYGAWWYNQQQYYVGVQDGYVAVFQGTNQSLAGMSLSKLLTRSTLQVTQLGLTDQNTLAQTISKSSVTDAKNLIDGLQNQADLCHQQWTALATWQAKTVSYNAAVAKDKASKAKPKPTVPASDAPGPQPATPDPDSCAPASAFGIPASALPGSQPVAPATAPTVKPSVTPTPTATVKASSTSAAG
jgi:PPM family protein phosphatase